MKNKLTRNSGVFARLVQVRLDLRIVICYALSHRHEPLDGNIDSLPHASHNS